MIEKGFYKVVYAARIITADTGFDCDETFWQGHWELGELVYVVECKVHHATNRRDLYAISFIREDGSFLKVSYCLDLFLEDLKKV